MKKFTAILLTVLMIASLFISCENKITPVIEETVSVSFDDSTSRSLTASLDAFNKEAYYWAYKAVKKDNTGLISGQTNFAWIDKGNTGLTKKIAGFSQGVWEFTLFAYTEEGKSHESYSETGLAYIGTNSSVTLVKNGDNKVNIRVNPISRGNGYLIVDTENINMNINSGSLTTSQLSKFEKKVKVTNLAGTEEKYPVSGKYTLPAGAYKVTVMFENTENSLEYASGSVVATVYANMTTTVQGTLDEILTNANFETEINPDVMNRSVSSDAYDTSTDGTIKINKNDSNNVDEKVLGTVPNNVAQSIISTAIITNSIDTANTTNSMKLSLSVDTISTGVTEEGKSTIGYEIGMSSILTSVNNTTNEIVQYSSPVTGTLDDYVVVEINLQRGLADVLVTHNGNAMEKLTGVRENPSEDNQYGAYYYDSSSGLLTIKTKSFSPFEVTYKAVSYIAEMNGVKYASIQDAINDAPEGKINDNATTITLLSSVGDGASFGFPDSMADKGKNICIDLNGNTYVFKSPAMGSTGYESQAMHLINGNKLTLKNGTISVSKDSVVIQRMIQSYCELVLEDVEIDCSNVKDSYNNSICRGSLILKGNTNLTASSNSAKIFDVDGTYGNNVSVVFEDTYTGTVSGIIEYVAASDDRYNSTLEIKSGYFTGSITSSGNTKPSITGGIFSFKPDDEYVSEGYCILQEGDTYRVTQGASVSNKDEFVAALSKDYINNIYIVDDFYIGSTVEINRDVTINGRGNTLTASYADPVIKITAKYKNVNINNLNINFPYYTAKEGIQAIGDINSLSFENVNITNAFKGIHFNDCRGTDISIKNCNLTSVYPFNVNGGSIKSMTIDNSTLNGWTSFSIAQNTYVFNNCHFGEGLGYATVKPYGNTNFDGCTFSADYFEGLEGGIATGTNTPITINFDNCYMVTSDGKTNELTIDLLKTAFNYEITSGSSSGNSTINKQYWYVNGEKIAFNTEQQM